MPEGEEPLGDLGELTFEQLIEKVQAARNDNKFITEERKDALLHLLEALSEDIAESPQENPDEDIPLVIPDSFTNIDIPTLDEDLKRLSEIPVDDEPPTDVPIGSVPLELALRENLSKITAHSRYQEVKKRRVGDFWDSSWTPAPFEEAITIDQLAGLDLATLFKKRMVTDTRVQSILRALNRVIDFLVRQDQVDPSTSSSPSLKEASAPVTDPKDKIKDERPQNYKKISISIADLGASAESLAIWEALNSDESHLLGGLDLASDLVSFFAPARCVSIILGAELSKAEQHLLKKMVNRAISSEVRELVLSLLRAPAVRVDSIAQALFGADLSISAHKRCIASLVARGLSAQEVSYKGRIFRGFWTTQPKLVAEIIRTIKPDKKPRRSSTQRAAPKELIKLLDPLLHTLIVKK